jgi:hypothetical protein
MAKTPGLGWAGNGIDCTRAVEEADRHKAKRHRAGKKGNLLILFSG